MRSKSLPYSFIVFFVLMCNCVSAQTSFENIIQIDGIAMTADSLRGVPYAVISIKSKNRGVEATYNGVFSVVCYKGDTLEFSSEGFRPKEYIVPSTVKGQYFSMIQLMVQDTFYLPETIVKPLPSKEGFTYAFLHWRIPNDQYELARRNTDAYFLKALAYTLPIDGHEAQSRLLQKQANEAVYYGQQPPMNIFNPIAWGQFFEAWKRGDFRTKSNPYINDSNNY